MECKSCGCTEFYTEQKGPHLGMYCSACKTWQKWVKGDNPKPAEEYKAEYMAKEPATDKQMNFIKMCVAKGIDKYKASRIIELLKG
jgi:uncharacterized Zn finger protein (UPF0148 family)